MYDKKDEDATLGDLFFSLFESMFGEIFGDIIKKIFIAIIVGIILIALVVFGIVKIFGFDALMVFLMTIFVLWRFLLR